MKNRLFFLMLAAAISLPLAACGRPQQTGFPSESGYTDAQLAIGSVNRFAGIVTSGSETKIEKDESKTIAELKVSVGDIVQKGQVLFTYDSAQAQLDYEKAALELEQLQLSLDSYAKQKAELEAEKAIAPESEQLSYTVQIQEIETTIRETNYTIVQQSKDVEALRKGLDHLEVKSPVSGKIQSIRLDDNENTDEEYDYDESSGSDAGTPFIVIMESDAFRIKAYINEANINNLNPGDPVTIRSRVNDQTWTGTLTSVDYENPQLQGGNLYDESGDAEVTASSKYPFYVEPDSSEGLMLGQHVYVELTMEYVIDEPSEESDEDEEDQESFPEEILIPDEDLSGSDLSEDQP